MSFLELLNSDNSISNTAIVRRLSRDLTGEVCHFSCGNGYRKRVAALF